MIPKPLLNIIREKQCIPIIGAGFSLNAKLDDHTMPTWNELTEKLADKLQIVENDPLLVSQKFQDEFDRPTLIQTIEDLLYKDRVKPDHVHNQFIKIPYFDIICTTNYDNLLEDACKNEEKPVKVIVEKQQISMYGSSQDLKILKIHGDLDHTHELVITKNDYSDYSEKKKEFEIYLSVLLMTKTPLFIGFSLQDPNFLQIKKRVDSLMGETGRKGYVILFDPNDEMIESYENMKLKTIPIITNNKTKSECLLELFNNISESSIIKNDTDMLISCNKSVLFKNQTLQIRTNVGKSHKQLISIYVKNENDEVIYQTDTNNSKIIQEGLLEKEVVLNEEKWKAGQNYVVFAEINGQKISDSFKLSKSLEIIAQTDKTVYIYGSDIILTGIVPQAAIGSSIDYKIFNESQNIIASGIIPIETEKTGIFQTLIGIEGESWKHRGEKFNIIIEYQGKSASVSIFTSNFGASIELDQKVYSWTDKVYLTVVAPDYNRDSDKIDIIGDKEDGLITIKTSLGKITKYKLVETGRDTGIFTGEVTLSGFIGKQIENRSFRRYPFGITRYYGSNNALIACLDEDIISVIFESPNQDPVVCSADIRWNIGEIQWVKANYHIGDHAIIRVIDPDMNLSPEEIDVFDIHIQSDSDKKGIKILVYETGTASGIFEGTICFNKNLSSKDGLLKVKEWDNIYAEYDDATLPNPYTTKDQLKISAITKIIPPDKKLLSPLERFTINKIWIPENKLNKTFKRKEIRLQLSNNQNNIQPYAVILQIQDSNGVIIGQPKVKTGKLSIQSQEVGFIIPFTNEDYNVTIFVWESMEESIPLCPPQTLYFSESTNFQA